MPAAQQVFNVLALNYLGLAGVSRGHRFGSDGLFLNSMLFAFVGGDGQLMVKLPAAQAATLLADAEAAQVRAGRGLMREWAGIPTPLDHSRAERWRNLRADVYRTTVAVPKI